jgi:1,2-phenylacetyl-CoA epoxidase catalytic subunit
LLKGELAAKQTELDTVRQGWQVTEAALQAQIAESEKRKEDGLATLKDASKKSDVFKKNYDGI